MRELHRLLDGGDDLIAADWCEENGLSAMSAALRRLAARGVTPEEDGRGCRWHEGTAAVAGSAVSGDPWDDQGARHDVPPAVWDHMRAWVFPAGVRWYERRSDAVFDLLRAVARAEGAADAAAR